MVFKYVVVQRKSEGDPAYIPLLQAQSVRKAGKTMMQLPPSTGDAWEIEQEEVGLEKLLGPVDDAEEEEEEEEAEEEAEEEEGHSAPLLSSLAAHTIRTSRRAIVCLRAL